jgi:hypothetical protein
MATRVSSYNLLGSQQDQWKRVQYKNGHNIQGNELIKRKMLNWYDLWLGPVQ